MNDSALAAKSSIFKNGVIKEEFVCSREVILMCICSRVSKALKVTESAVREDLIPAPRLQVIASLNKWSQLNSLSCLFWSLAWNRTENLNYPWIFYLETELNITM